MIDIYYPLVMTVTHITIENGPVETVCFPVGNGDRLSSFLVVQDLFHSTKPWPSGDFVGQGPL